MKIKETQHRKTYSVIKVILYNVLGAVIGYGVIHYCFTNVVGYSWVYNSLLTGNYKFAKEHKYLTVDQRREIKLGTSFTYLDYLKKNSPENAVILMPKREAYNSQGQKKFFDQEIQNKLFRLRVLYPRKIVDADDRTNIYVKQITHIAIVNGHGYEWINVEMNEKPPFAIFPVKQ